MRLLFVRYFKNWRVQVFPTICIILYILFTVTDLYTTYLSTPNLKSESNPVYQYFKWGWSGHLLYISAMVLMTITFAVISNNYMPFPPLFAPLLFLIFPPQVRKQALQDEHSP